MKKTTFLIVGKHAVVEALKNPKRRIEKVFVTEDAQKNPGKHPNIDRLLTVMENEEPLDLKIIKN